MRLQQERNKLELQPRRRLRPRSAKPEDRSAKKPEDLVFDASDDVFDAKRPRRSFLERLGAGRLLLQPNATETPHATPISALPPYQTNVAMYMFDEVERGDLYINGDVLWFHPRKTSASPDVTNDPLATNPLVYWGKTPRYIGKEVIVTYEEALNQPILCESRSGDPVIYLGDGLVESAENYDRED